MSAVSELKRTRKALSISRVIKLIVSKNVVITRLILRTLMRLDNFGYKNIARLATIAEGGIHPKHRLTDYHQFFVNNVSPQDIVLDIGCGNGFLTYDVAKKARSVMAIDSSMDNIELANKSLLRVPLLNRDWLTYYKRELGVEYRLDLTHKVEYTMESLAQELEKAGIGIERVSAQFGEIWAVTKRLT